MPLLANILTFSIFLNENAIKTQFLHSDPEHKHTQWHILTETH